MGARLRSGRALLVLGMPSENRWRAWGHCKDRVAGYGAVGMAAAACVAHSSPQGRMATPVRCCVTGAAQRVRRH